VGEVGISSFDAEEPAAWCERVAGFLFRVVHVGGSDVVEDDAEGGGAAGKVRVAALGLVFAGPSERVTQGVDRVGSVTVRGGSSRV
jgi:hypothetical protein